MSEDSDLITATTGRILDDLCTSEVIESAEQGVWPEALWRTLEETGLTLAGVGEKAGGSGGELQDALLVIREAARHAAPLPLGETFVAAKLLESVGASIPAGPLTVAAGSFTLERGAEQFTLTGRAMNVPFVPWCDWTVLAATQEGEWKLCCVQTHLAVAEPLQNMAGEPRHHLRFDCPITPEHIHDFEGEDLGDILLCLGALVRSVMMAGALESVLSLSVQYATERQQFGRPIAKFQAIQQQLAILAGEVAVCQRGADAVADYVDDLDPLEVAVAKARIGEAVSLVTDIAHQVHGAMGYTREHVLNLRTRRLWTWREEFGNESYWQRRLGEAVTSLGADNIWNYVTST